MRNDPARGHGNHVMGPGGSAPSESGFRVGAANPGGTTRSGGTLPMWRIGAAGGVVGIMCCVGPALLALVGSLRR
jgi:hypothetical protein